MPFMGFIEALEEHARSGKVPPYYVGKVPLRAELPEVAEEIEAAPSCPRRVLGSCFGAHIKEGVFTYLGAGRNTTSVHFDGHENLLLCLRGTKRLHLYPPSDACCLYPVNDYTRSSVLPFVGFEQLSPEMQSRYALVSRARPLEILVEAGDLFYLPTCWWHCVEGSDGINMILNWWFSLHADKVAAARAMPVDDSLMSTITA
eukprot:NODE_11180_length_1302_cov_12.258723.p3 GENE.NODE_11180_length_1302_cov_12.258723~~NODE_11180_length_1302_cov_12.258723.p3  ORF type:complete len:202 (-),score=41.88 NODE_11180_length_1302_cov_12.258723:221-826(-)